MTETIIALVGCGKAKRDYRSKARNLYTSTYFEKKRRFADVACDEWFVLSAEHGLIEPNDRIDPYDTHIDDVDAMEFNRRVCEQSGNYWDMLTGADRVVVLAGSKYIDTVDAFLASLPSDVEYPFDDTGGIGEQLSKLDDMTPPLSPKDFRREAALRSPVDVYTAGMAAGISVRYYWPFKLVSVDNLSIRNTERTKRTCDTLMVDSGIGNEDVENIDVLDTAAEVDADYIIPKDYLHDRERTTESVREFFDLYDDHECDAKPVVPLQPPHHIHAEDFPDRKRFAIGGIKDRDPPEQIRAIQKTREEVGGDAYLHALGMGASRRIVDALRSNPALVDSVDTSTPEFAPARHRTPDKSLVQKTGGFELPGGDDTSTGKAIASELILWQMSHMLNPDWRGDGNDSPGVQAGVDQFV